MVAAPGPANRPRAVVAAEQGGREVDDVAVDQAGGVEGVGDGRAAFDHQLEHAPAAEVVEHRAEVAVELEARVHRGARRAPWPSTTRSGSVSSGPARRREAHGERGVVGPHGAGADEDGVAVGPQPVGVEAGLRRR